MRFDGLPSAVHPPFIWPLRTANRSKEKMHLMFHVNSDGSRLYTLKKQDAKGRISKSAHPGPFLSLQGARLHARGWDPVFGLALVILAQHLSLLLFLFLLRNHSES